MIAYFVGTLPHFLLYFSCATLLAIAFLLLYTMITPHREFALIREGNAAVATQLVGSFIGFALPVASVISHSVSITDMLLWGGVATIVQLAVFVVISRLLFREIEAKISEGCMASGIFVGGIGAGFGLLQSACMVP